MLLINNISYFKRKSFTDCPQNQFTYGYLVFGANPVSLYDRSGLKAKSPDIKTDYNMDEVKHAHQDPLN
jgi:hypothetical protein